MLLVAHNACVLLPGWVLSAIHFPFRKEGEASYCRKEVEGKGEGADISVSRRGQRVQHRQTGEGKEELSAI